jgi:DNA-binding transcriptional MerR regulator
MSDNIELIEKNFTTKDIARMVGIAEPTVRKYSAYLENAAYIFEKDSSGARIFSHRDAMAIQHVKTLRDKTKISVEQAASIVVSKHAQGVAYGNIDETKTGNEKRLEELEKKLDAQNDLIKNLFQALEEREKQRDQTLIQYLREVQEAKQFLLTTKEEEPKKGLFARLFGR